MLAGQHNKTKRNYIERMAEDKVHCMEVAQQYGKDYWDGDRKYGYGGYYYDGRWESVAQKFIDHYALTGSSKVLDIGCGKAHLLYEIKKKIGCEVVGLDISKHGIENAPVEVRGNLLIYDINNPLNFDDKEFDLAISIMTLHNLELEALDKSISETSRVSKKSYIAVESYRSQKELFNLQCWALTCQSFFSPKEWEYIFRRNSYDGEYELLVFE